VPRNRIVSVIAIASLRHQGNNRFGAFIAEALHKLTPPFPNLSTRSSSPQQFLHSTARLSRCVNFSPTAECLQSSVRCSEIVPKGSALPVIFSRVNSPGEIRRMSSAPLPGLCGLLEKSSPWEDGSAECTPEAQVSGVLLQALSGVRLRDVLSLRRKTTTQSVRDNNAARVAGPGRICFFIFSDFQAGGRRLCAEV
jgi:hypothetical protein